MSDADNTVESQQPADKGPPQEKREKRKNEGDDGDSRPKRRLLSTISSAPAPPFRTMRAEKSVVRPASGPPQPRPREPRPAVPSGQGDERVQRRNRRLFGALLQGTLTAAKREVDQERNRDTVTARQRELTKKVEAKDEAERKQLMEEYKTIQEEKRRAKKEKERERRKRELEERIARIKNEKEEDWKRIHPLWITHHETVSHFLFTSGDTPIAFRPASNHKATDELFEKQKPEREARVKQAREREINYGDAVVMEEHKDGQESEGENEKEDKEDNGVVEEDNEEENKDGNARREEEESDGDEKEKEENGPEQGQTEQEANTTPEAFDDGSR